MKLLIDDANVEAIKRISEYYPIDGVTTNPSILTKCGRYPYRVLKEIRSIIGSDAELHVQVISRKAEGMVAEAHKIVEMLGAGTYVKIPAVPEGIKAMKKLSAEGIKITATAVYTVQQGYLAGKAGADYVAPYVNRIDNLGGDGVQVAERIQDIFVNNDMETEILAASFKNTQQVLELAEYGIGAATAAPDIIEGMLKNQIVTDAVEAFISDFENLCGKRRTMLDCR